jgi:hypothetical protein
MLTTRLAILAAAFLWVSTARAQTVVHYPDDGDPSLQTAVERAGCGGTLYIGPGTYHGRIQFPPRGEAVPPACAGLKILGAGVGVTTLDATGSGNFPLPGTNIPIDPPLVILGPSPFSPADQMVPGYELAYLTVRASALPEDSPTGVGCSWSIGCHMHDLELDGFRSAMLVDEAIDADLHDIHINGPYSTPPPGAKTAAGIYVRQPVLYPIGAFGGSTIHEVTIDTVTLGVLVYGVTDTSIHDSVFRHVSRDVRALVTERLDLHHNLFAVDDGLSFFIFTNTQDSSVHHNVLCEGPIGLLISDQAPLLGLGASMGNVFHHNTLLGLAQAVSPDPLPGDNAAFNNLSDPSGVCPP